MNKIMKIVEFILLLTMGVVLMLGIKTLDRAVNYDEIDTNTGNVEAYGSLNNNDTNNVNRQNRIANNDKQVTLSNGDRRTLPILMYHNILENHYKESTYEITAKSLEDDLKWIRDNGYVTVNTDMLCNYVNNGNLPNKIIMLTFDDGFYSYMKALPKLMEKYDMRCIVGVVGDFTKFNKNSTASKKYRYLDYDDMSELSNTGRIEIANHTYDNHKINSNSQGIAPKKGESYDEYRIRMGKDIATLEGKLKEVNVKMSCYVYPYGLYTRASERIVKEHNYRMTLTCAEKVNVIGRNANDLYELGRFNRTNYKSAESIISAYGK